MKHHKPWIIAVLAAVLFLSGATTGFLIGRFAMPRPPRFNHTPPTPAKIKAMMSERMFERLKLTAAQQQSISPAVDNWFDKLNILRRKGIPDIQKVFEELFVQVEKVLTPEQKTELEKVRRQTIEHLNRDVQKFPRRPPPRHDGRPEGHDEPPPPPPLI